MLLVVPIIGCSCVRKRLTEVKRKKMEGFKSSILKLYLFV